MLIAKSGTGDGPKDIIYNGTIFAGALREFLQNDPNCDCTKCTAHLFT